MADIEGMPMLGRVVQRVRRARKVDEVVVATTILTEDDCIADYCEQCSIPHYRGSPVDVLDRYYMAASVFGETNTVVRVTADCPMIDPRVIDAVVRKCKEGAFDYVSNVDPPTYPDGLDVEVFGWRVLRTLWRVASSPADREHVTSFVRHHPEVFMTANVTNDGDLSHMRWTVDEAEDLLFVREVYRELGDDFVMGGMLDLLKRRPELIDINAKFDSRR